ncbi:MAG: antitoxin [Burkholderiales bacterium]|jgi:hypothetical protein|nr:antitoxin [Burkholderiales bacterium]
MRTTLTLDDDAFATARTYAQARAIKLGQAVSELVKRGAAVEAPALRQVDGIWVFDLPEAAPPVTAEQVRRLLDEAV